MFLESMPSINDVFPRKKNYRYFQCLEGVGG